MDKFRLMIIHKVRLASSPSSPTVKLIRALRLPARHAKVIKFRTELIDSVKNSDQTLMFEPAQHELEEHGTISCGATKEWDRT